MATQVEIARRTGLDISSVNKILNRKSRYRFRAATVRKVLKAARELNYDFGRLKHEHRRQHPRRHWGVPVELSLHDDAGALFDRACAVLSEASLSGGLLVAIAMPKASFPLRSGYIGVRLLSGPQRGTELKGLPVRLIHESDGLALAVRFADPASQRSATERPASEDLNKDNNRETLSRLR